MLTELVKRSAPLPAGSKLLVLGGGFSGQHVAALVKALGNTVLCSRRKINSPGADLAFDGASKLLPAQKALEGVTHLLSCIPPAADGTDPVLACLGDQLKTLPLQWVGYLSTTGVYGDCQGHWVTEADHPQPQQARSKRRLKCEQAWQASGLPLQVLRLPGIYGPGRSVLQSVNTGKSKMIYKPNQVFSRLHVDDLAGAILHMIHCAANRQRPVLINVADDKPTTKIELLRFAAKLLGKSLPEIESFEAAATHMSSMALSFWQENRRVSNQLLCKELGYSLIHPDYHSGLRDCFLVEGFKASQTNHL